MREFLAWLVPPMDLPGRKRDYSHVVVIFGCVPAAGWLLYGLPFVVTVLVGAVALALLLAWLL